MSLTDRVYATSKIISRYVLHCFQLLLFTILVLNESHFNLEDYSFFDHIYTYSCCL